MGSVATIKAIQNSILSLNKYSNNVLKPSLLNVFGEWDFLKEEFEKKGIEIIDLQKRKIDTRTFGYLKSRIIYILIFLTSFFPLKNIIKKNNPNYLVVHLITSLPIFLYSIFNFETKLILRISGFPKLNFFRKLLWTLGSKKIFKVICPTVETANYLKSLNIFYHEKIIFIEDPIINISEINKKKKIKISEELLNNKPYMVNIGRLTNQKNQNILIESFNEIKDLLEKYKLIIVGDGEKFDELNYKIKRYNLKDKIYLIGYKENIFNILKNSTCLIQTSKWEDPGFTIFESAATNTSIISSDCPNGPSEFIENEKCGYLFKNNDFKSLSLAIKRFLNDETREISRKKINAKKKIKKYTLLCHYKKIKNCL